MLRFTQIVQNLVLRGNIRANARLNELDTTASKELTSVRLRPETKAYLQAQSEIFGVSLSQVINIILDGVVSMETKTTASNKINQIYDRIMTLFEAHHINVIDMAKMLSAYDIKLTQLRTPEVFIDLLSTEVIKDIALWFGVDYRWVIGETDRMYEPREIVWYKSAYSFSMYLAQMNYIHNDLKIYVVKKSNVDFKDAERTDNNEERLDMGFVISYEYEVNGVQFTRYEVGEFQRWNYEKCRGYLRFIFYFLDNMRSRIRSYGVSLSENAIDGLVDGTVMPATLKSQMHESWLLLEKIGDIKRNYDIEQDNFEYLQRTERLIKLVGANSPIICVQPAIQNFANGWMIKFETKDGIQNEFYRDFGHACEDIAEKCLIK